MQNGRDRRNRCPRHPTVTLLHPHRRALAPPPSWSCTPTVVHLHPHRHTRLTLLSLRGVRRAPNRRLPAPLVAACRCCFVPPCRAIGPVRPRPPPHSRHRRRQRQTSSTRPWSAGLLGLPDGRVPTGVSPTGRQAEEPPAAPASPAAAASPKLRAAVCRLPGC